MPATTIGAEAQQANTARPRVEGAQRLPVPRIEVPRQLQAGRRRNIEDPRERAAAAQEQQPRQRQPRARSHRRLGTPSPHDMHRCQSRPQHNHHRYEGRRQDAHEADEHPKRQRAEPRQALGPRRALQHDERQGVSQGECGRPNVMQRRWLQSPGLPHGRPVDIRQ